jgi:nitrogen fixation protein FixH
MKREMNPPRNLWPLGIILTFAVFVSGTAGLIVMACSQKLDLVSANYYEQELKFQGQIDRLERTRRAASQASVTYDPAAKCITISLPADQAQRKVSGRIELYRPSAAGMDRTVKLEPDANGVQHLDAAGLAPGLWKVRVSWTVEHQGYFLDQKVVVGSRDS